MPGRAYHVMVVLCIAGLGCAVDPEPPPPLLRDRSVDLPERLSALELYYRLPDRDAVSPEAHSYRPRYALWSNGSVKERFVVLPPGGSVDTSERSAWRFPEGTLFFKTFLYEEPETGVLRPVETRVMRLRGGEWEFDVYGWNDEATDATLLDIDRPIDVPVTDVDGDLVHVIPSRRDCRTCHESQPDIVIGFDELRLADQLAALHEDGVLGAPPPAEPEHIEAPDALTGEVLGYLHGNCGHCHNGIPGPSTSFDMRHPVALENLIDRPVESSGGPGGIRIVPGDAESSVLYQLFTASVGDEMPPLGVQRRDEEAATMLRRWIEGLE